MLQAEQPPLRAVVVGAGLMGRWHADAIRHAGEHVIAVVDPDEERAANLVKRLGGAVIYACLEDALSQTHPDVVHLCTPTSIHHKQTEQALKAGAHVLVEKPLAATWQGAQEIMALAKNTGLSVCPIHQFIFQDGVQHIKKWLQKSGRIAQVSFVIHSAGGIGLASGELDMLVAEIIPHPLSILQALLPGSLESSWVVNRPAPGELRVFGSGYGFDVAGIGFAIEISLRARPTLNSFSIAAERTTLIADLFHGYAFRLPGTVSRAHKIVQPFEISLRLFGAATNNLVRRSLRGEGAYPGLRNLVALFYRSLRTGNQLPIPAQDTLAVERARHAILAN